MINKYGIFFTCEKEGKFYHHYAESEDMLGVARCLITFKPRKGWSVAKVEISEAEQMELELFDKSRWED